VVVFTSLLALVRSFAQEREHGIWDGILSAPIDRAAIWAARSTATIAFLVITQAVALPLFWLFFLQDGRSPSLWVLACALLLADLGVAMLGSLLAGLASQVQAREVLLPVLFLPFAVPLVTVAVRVTVNTISPQTSGFSTFEGLGFLALYDTIFGLLGWALFEYVVED
jgi:heme exporter protein B